MRLIDADKLMWRMGIDSNDRQIFFVTSKDIDEQPTVDAVEVVRCKDCKYYNPELQRCNHPCLDYDVECFDHWIDTEPDDFCSYGKRGSEHET